MSKVVRDRSGGCFARPKQWVRSGPDSLPESNRPVGSLNLHDWCFRVARQAPSLYRATEGSANEAADVRLESFGLTRGLSAAANGSTLLTALSLSKWSAFPEGAIASILRDAFGGEPEAGRLLAGPDLLFPSIPLYRRVHSYLFSAFPDIKTPPVLYPVRTRLYQPPPE